MCSSTAVASETLLFHTSLSHSLLQKVEQVSLLFSYEPNSVGKLNT